MEEICSKWGEWRSDHTSQQRQPKPLRETTPWLFLPSQSCPFTMLGHLHWRQATLVTQLGGRQHHPHFTG